MSVVQTILVFAVAPAAIVGVIALLIFGPGAARAPRYRPGREWPYEPVWYAPHPRAIYDAPDGERQVGRAELTTGVASQGSAGDGSEALTEAGPPTAAGGARGTW